MPTAQGTATVGRLHDEIQGVRYREATETICRLVAAEGRPLKSMIQEASAAAAYVQVLSHLMRLPSGEPRGVNYDHTILGWRGAVDSRAHTGAREAVRGNRAGMASADGTDPPTSDAIRIGANPMSPGSALPRILGSRRPAIRPQARRNGRSPQTVTRWP